MKRLLPAGTEVEFDTDVEPLDRFGRSLVYLYKDASAKLQQQQRSTAREAKEVAAFEANPGDVKDCADFDSYDEAKAWFDSGPERLFEPEEPKKPPPIAKKPDPPKQPAEIEKKLRVCVGARLEAALLAGDHDIVAAMHPEYDRVLTEGHLTQPALAHAVPALVELAARRREQKLLEDLRDANVEAWAKARGDHATLSWLKIGTDKPAQSAGASRSEDDSASLRRVEAIGLAARRADAATLKKLLSESASDRSTLISSAAKA
ncbi:hypothetical protein Ctob_005507, partial [Chrysochromulina tobinii]